MFEQKTETKNGVQSFTVLNSKNTTAINLTIQTKTSFGDLISHVATLKTADFEMVKVGNIETYRSQGVSKDTNATSYNTALYLFDLNDERVIVGAASSELTPSDLKIMTEKVIESLKRK